MRGILVALLAVALLAVAGCGGTGAVKAVPSADRAKAEAVVKTCLTKSHTPKSFETCVAPKGHEAALQACAVKAFEHSLRKSTLEGKLADCVVNNR
jgi:predicted small lipoprotein YifL